MAARDQCRARGEIQLSVRLQSQVDADDWEEMQEEDRDSKTLKKNAEKAKEDVVFYLMASRNLSLASQSSLFH